MPQDKQTQDFIAIHLEGGFLPAEFLKKVSDFDAGEQKPDDYHIYKGLNLKDEISRAYRIAQSLWQDFKLKKEIGEPSKVTVEGWLIPLLEDVLGYQNITSSNIIFRNDRAYPITNWSNTEKIPLVLTAYNYELDKVNYKFGEENRRRSPQALLQEFLNVEDSYLYGLVSNGLKIRILRDNLSLTRPAYVEADLEQILEEELYADFSAFWLLFHASRLVPDSQNNRQCVIERWRISAHQTGERALKELRKGVTQALRCLGTGFLEHSDNKALREALFTRALTKEAFFQELLRLVYRLLFLFTVEDRGLLHLKDASELAKLLYQEGYSISLLRERALKRRYFDKYTDLWEGLSITFQGLSNGTPALGLPALGGGFSDKQCPNIDECLISNQYLLQAIRALAYFEDENSRSSRKQYLSRVNYKDMDTEELGSVYESLLELHPQINVEATPWTFGFAGDQAEKSKGKGSERKTSGSYYTHSSLVNQLIKTALVPVIDNKLKENPSNPKEALLKIRICDPSCGSGHFLLASARKLAVELAKLEMTEDVPEVEVYRHAMREVVQHCIYGVDINPMAVELCKVALWIETVEPGKPLGFLDYHIQCGNSLLGATPALLHKGIPDEAFTAIEGDDKKYCTELRKQNKTERAYHEANAKQLKIEDADPWDRLGDFASEMAGLINMAEETIEDVKLIESRYQEIIQSSGYEYGRLWADAWCAAFVWKKDGSMPVITEEHYRKIEKNPFTISESLRIEIKRLSDTFQFFHWHLAFPNIFKVDNVASSSLGWNGGFDVVLGNPPWDKLQPEEQKYFSNIRPDIAIIDNASKRKGKIEELAEEDAYTYKIWMDHKQKLSYISNFVKQSKVLPLTSEGNLNYYRLFSELATKIIDTSGRAGLVVQTGIATDETAKEFIYDQLSKKQILEFYDFENRGKYFQDVHAQFRFSLVVFAGANQSSTSGTKFGWLLHDLEEINIPDRVITMTAEDIALFNPSSMTCPIFCSLKDFELSRKIYLHGKHIYISPKNRYQNIGFQGELFNMTRDSKHFIASETVPDGNYLPLYEAKYIHQFDHRYATYAEGKVQDVTLSNKSNVNFAINSKSVVPLQEVKRRTDKQNIESNWLLGFRDISSPTNERTALFTIFPYAAVGNNINLILGLDASEASLLVANTNSFIFDYCCRQKISGSHVNIWIAKQLPVIDHSKYAEKALWDKVTLNEWITNRVIELIYTSSSLKPFAEDLGYMGNPYIWDEERRFILRCELDAAYFHLYGIERDEASYILEAFPLVKKRDEDRNGDYRTKNMILEIYDGLTKAIKTNVPYQSQLLPLSAETSSSCFIKESAEV